MIHLMKTIKLLISSPLGTERVLWVLFLVKPVILPRYVHLHTQKRKFCTDIKHNIRYFLAHLRA